MRNIIVVACLLLGLVPIEIVAQGQSDLDALDNKLSRYLETTMPGWNHKRVEPMRGSVNVLDARWSFRNRKVKVAILLHNSPEEARAAIREGRKSDRQSEELPGLGDEAYAWGYVLSNVAFTRGRFNVYVTTYAEVESDPDARMLSEVERDNRERSEMRRLSREFAKHVADAIDLP